MKIQYNGYSAGKGSTTVDLFWTDMHIETFRADKVIESFEDLQEVVERFKVNRAAFDITNYDSGEKFFKANREYESYIERRVNFEVIVFMYKGKKYRTRTCKHFRMVSNIRRQADEILSHITEDTLCLVSDATGEVVGKGELIRTLDRSELLF